MNYKKIYDSIIKSRKVNVLLHDKDNYSERHHIIPVSLGGTDNKVNLVRLTAREHFICHALLVRMYEKINANFYESMLYAFNNMKSSNSEHKRYFNSRLFDKYKIEFSRMFSKRQTGDGNTQYNTMWITNRELEKNKKIHKDSIIPNGWSKGRTINFKKYNENIIFYNDLGNKFLKDSISWEEFKVNYNLDIESFKVFNSKIKKYTNLVLKNNIFIHNHDVYNNKEEYDNKILELTNYYKGLWYIYKYNSFKDFCKITGYTNTNTTLNCLLNKYLKITVKDREERKEILKNIDISNKKIEFTELKKLYDNCEWKEFCEVTNYNKTKTSLLRNFRKYVN